jgi:hypothetical protein
VLFLLSLACRRCCFHLSHLKRFDIGTYRYSILNIFGVIVGSTITTMSSDKENEDDQKTGAERILEMLRQAGVSTENLEEKKHPFWDTQVRAQVHYLKIGCRCICLVCLMPAVFTLVHYSALVAHATW